MSLQIQAIQDGVSAGFAKLNQGVSGTCDLTMSGSTTTIVCLALAGYGDDYFNNKYFMTVIKIFI